MRNENVWSCEFGLSEMCNCGGKSLFICEFGCNQDEGHSMPFSTAINPH
jgi:hypothetical protein